MADEAQNPDQTPQTAPPANELAQPVSEPEPVPKPAEPVPNEPIEAKPPEAPTAQIPANEPLSPEPEPIVIPPFENSPTPAPASAPEARTDSTHSPQGGRDLLVKARASIQDRKRKKLQKILELLDAKKKVTNDEVEKLLHVSDATATRYLSALEKQGTIKQVGRTGKAVVYTRI
jgi:ribosomal protein S25